jgi:hypothetical protein
MMVKKKDAFPMPFWPAKKAAQSEKEPLSK